MIFQNFCKREFVDPISFAHYIIMTVHNPVAFMEHEDLLGAIWKEFLSFQYMRMLATEESK